MLSVDVMPEPEPEPAAQGGDGGGGGGGGAGAPLAEQTSSKRKLDELFFLWLGLAETSELVTALVEDMRSGKPLPLPARAGSPSASASPLSPVSRLLSSNRDIGGDWSPGRHQPTTPPRSPKSPRSGLRASATLATDGLPPASPRASLSRPAAVIPQFYFPPGIAVTPPDEEERLCRLADELFGAGVDDRLGIDALRDVSAQVAGLPRFFAAKLIERLGKPTAAIDGEAEAEPLTVAKADFMQFWRSEIKDASLGGRVFAALKQAGAKFVVPRDWHAVMQELLETHAGLDFLRDTKEFQARYVETVITRIYFTLDRRGLGRLALRDIERGELLAALSLVDTDDDINKELQFFSYEHFYVLYCKFWELDADHDLEINR
jgi:serine/threonine-protein phosphatase 2A regulatory subunit B''